MKRLISLFITLVMLFSMPCALAADGGTTNGEGADAVLGLVSNMLERDKLDTLLGIIEAYSLYEYDGDDEILKSAVVSFFAKHPELFEEFANDIFGTQDQYSHYMKPSTYESSYVLDETFVGIGVELDAAQNGVIIAVIPNSPAEEAGIKAGDEIVSADGEYLESTYYKALQEKLRGEEGTEVTVGVLRDGEELEFTMIRRKVEISNIAMTDLGNGIAYIRIARFGDMPNTFIDFVNAYSDLDEQGFTSVIFDVRDNTGGSLDTLLNMLHYSFWEPELPMFTLRFRDDEESETYYSLGAGWEPEMMVILTNGNTASAAELFSGALGYVEGAWIIGEDEYTYGKGVGQSHITLGDESVAIITTMEVIVGEDIPYNEEGIVSDITVAQEEALVFKDELLPLRRSPRMYTGAYGKNVFALEQRLCLLGYSAFAPDGLLSKCDMEALDRFRAQSGLTRYNYVDSETMFALDAAMDDAPEFAYYDAALSEAVSLCTGF